MLCSHKVSAYTTRRACTVHARVCVSVRGKWGGSGGAEWGDRLIWIAGRRVLVVLVFGLKIVV